MQTKTTARKLQELNINVGWRIKAILPGHKAARGPSNPISAVAAVLGLSAAGLIVAIIARQQAQLAFAAAPMLVSAIGLGIWGWRRLRREWTRGWIPVQATLVDHEIREASQPGQRFRWRIVCRFYLNDQVYEATPEVFGRVLGLRRDPPLRTKEAALREIESFSGENGIELLVDPDRPQVCVLRHRDDLIMPMIDPDDLEHAESSTGDDRGEAAADPGRPSDGVPVFREGSIRRFLSFRERPPTRAGYGAPVMLTVFGAMVCVVGATVVLDGLRSEDWPSVPGVVTHSNVVRKDKRTESHRVIVHYRYDVAGQSYDGKRRYFSEPSYRSRSEALDASRSYPVGEIVTVYYDPKAPDSAVLKMGMRDEAYFPLGFGILFMTPGLLLIWRHRRRMIGAGKPADGPAGDVRFSAGGRTG